MNGWSILGRPQFDTILEQAQSDLDSTSQRLDASSYPLAETEVFIKKSEEFFAFKDAVRNLATSPNPLEVLTYLARDGNNDEYYYLSVGGWKAYYYIDQKAKAGIALLALHNLRRSRHDILQSLSDALTEYRKNG